MTERDNTKPLNTQDKLRNKYGEPSKIAVAIIKTQLDTHHQNFIHHSPFICISSASKEGQPNVSPKGDAPGFVHIIDNKTLAIPDRPGNNKVETFQNLVDNPKIALIFFIPGIHETLRVHGVADIVQDSDILDLGKVNNKLPPSALVVHVTKAYMHCGKAMIRSKLWEPESHIADGIITPFAQVAKEQASFPIEIDEVHERLQHSYNEKLY